MPSVLFGARPSLLLALVLAAAPARAKVLDWAEDPASARDPAFAVSRAICRGLAGKTPPAGDMPNPAETVALGDCSSEALLFGIGMPADPRAARLCAFVEKRTADPQVTDFGFTGDRTLMTVYADGLGAARDLDLATALACRTGGAPAEIDARVRRLARLKAEGWGGSDFGPCQDAMSPAMRATCADHDQLLARSNRGRAFAVLTAGWNAADRAAFAPLRRSASLFADAHAQGETPARGADREVAAVAAEEEAERAFATLLADAEAGRVAPASAGEAAGAEAAEAAAARAASDVAPRRITAADPVGLKPAERAWTRYRDAWTAFAGWKYPSLSDPLRARLARERAAQLAAPRP